MKAKIDNKLTLVPFVPPVRAQLQRNYRLSFQTAHNTPACLIIRTCVPTKLLSQPIKVNYQKNPTPSVGREVTLPEKPCRANEQHLFGRWSQEKKKKKSELGKRRGMEREERGMEHNIDYLIMHFIISVTTECLPSLTAWPTCAAVPPFNEVDKE